MTVAGPHKPGSLPAHSARRSGPPMRSDNVGRMHAFMQAHPEVKITVPKKNGTDDFIATWPDGEMRDRSLGWLMDKLEERFKGPIG